MTDGTVIVNEDTGISTLTADITSNIIEKPEVTNKEQLGENHPTLNRAQRRAQAKRLQKEYVNGGKNNYRKRFSELPEDKQLELYTTLLEKTRNLNKLIQEENNNGNITETDPDTEG